MPRNPNAATIAVQLSPQLKAALQDAAQKAGCSLNGYAVQVLAAAAGDPSRFRLAAQPEPTVDERIEAVRALKRDHLGNPATIGERMRHRQARRAFLDHFHTIKAPDDGIAWTITLDVERPWHYVEWAEFGAPLLPEGLEPRRRAAS